jgi:hypothetical protein
MLILGELETCWVCARRHGRPTREGPKPSVPWTRRRPSRVCEVASTAWVPRSRILPVASLLNGATRSAAPCRSRFRNQAPDDRRRMRPSRISVRRSPNATSRPTTRLARSEMRASGNRFARVVSGTVRTISGRSAILSRRLECQCAGGRLSVSRSGVPSAIWFERSICALISAPRRRARFVSHSHTSKMIAAANEP